eukprot:GHUV01025423.1.p1 GENE.GHUV01025423.1~~GHUV01025423.1.p1  ORF type:complete len:185 (+),score=68.50 GHUV01025423.1:919-1473(+)
MVLWCFMLKCCNTVYCLLCCRCRWLRTLMLNHAVFHTALRRLPPEAVGVVIMHLPVAWRRLQYLAESAQENAVSLMDAVQMYDGKFTQAFPEYAKWRCWTDGQSEPQACGAPWRSAAARKQQLLQDQQQQQQPTQQQRRHQLRARALKLAARRRLLASRQEQQQRVLQQSELPQQQQQQDLEQQ